MTYEADLPPNPASKEYNVELQVCSCWSQTTKAVLLLLQYCSLEFFFPL